MSLLRIQQVTPLGKQKVRLDLTDGSVVERDLSNLLLGSIFDSIRSDPTKFREVRVEAGTLVWPNGADLCPDMVIWGGAPPKEASRPPQTAAPKLKTA